MRLLRRWRVWSLLILLVGLSAWWLLYVPYQPTLLLDAIPADASAVSVHTHFPERWDLFLQNSLTRSVFRSFGLEEQALVELENDPQARQWVEQFANRRAVVAYVPHMPSSGGPAWVFASWLGGESQRLRWRLSLFQPPGFRRVLLRPGTPYWILSGTALRSDLYLGLSLVEGVLLGCISPEPHAIADVILTSEGRLPSIRLTPEHRLFERLTAESLAPDAGWITLGTPGHSSDSSAFFAYELINVASNQLRARISLDSTVSDGEPTMPSQFPELERFPGGAAQALIAARPMLLLDVLAPFLPNLFRELAIDLTTQQEAQTAVVAMTGDEQSGRLFGLRVPGLMIGIPLADADDARIWLWNALDRLNARYRWALIPHEIESSGVRMYVVDGSASRAFDRLPLGERPACAVIGNWFWLAGNLDVLRQMLRRPESEAAAPVWLKWAEESHSPLLAWADLVRGGRTIRLALATYALKLRLEAPPDPSGAMQKRFETYRAWIEALAPFNEAWLNMDANGSETRLNIMLGESP